MILFAAFLQNEDLGLNDINTDHYGAVDYPEDGDAAGDNYDADGDESPMKVAGPAYLPPPAAVVLSDR